MGKLLNKVGHHAEIWSHAPSDEYREGWDRVFAKAKEPEEDANTEDNDSSVDCPIAEE